jgi:hypothetical protein
LVAVGEGTAVGDGMPVGVACVVVVVGVEVAVAGTDMALSVAVWLGESAVSDSGVQAARINRKQM